MIRTARTSNIDVAIRLRGHRAFQAQVRRSAAELEALGVRGVRSLARFSAQADRLKNFGRTMSRNVTLPVLAVGVVAGKAAVDFDRSMRNVNSIAQLSERQFQGLSQSVLDLAEPTAQQPKVLADAMYDLVSSGFSAEESLRVLASSAKAATAGLTTAEVSTSAVAAVLNAYRLPAKQAADVSDVLFRTVDRGVISFEDLASNIGDVLPFASSLGVDLRQVGASIATMTKAGISPSETMTRIKAVMVSMLKPSEALADTFEKLGFESGEAMIKQLGFQGSLDALAEATGGSKTEMAKLFPNIRALGGALALTGENSKVASEDVKGLADATGATDRALSQQSKSIAFQFQRIKAAATAVAIEAAPRFLAAAETMIGAVRGLVGWFGKLPTGMQNAIVTSALFLAAIGPVAWMLGVLASGAGRLIIVLAALAKAWVFVRAGGLAWIVGLALMNARLAALAVATRVMAAAQWVLNVAMAANPVGIIVVAIAALVAALVLAYTKVKWFRDAVDAVFSWIKDHWQLLAVILGGPIGLAAVLIVKHWNTIKGAATAAADWIAGAFRKVASVLKGIFNVIAGAAKVAWGVIKTAAKVAFAAIVITTKPFYLALRATFLGIKAAAVTAFKVIRGAAKIAATVLRAAFKVIKAVAVPVFNAIRKVAGAVFGWLRGVAAKIGGWFKTAFGAVRSAVGTAFEAIKKVAGPVFNWLRGAIGDIAGWFKRTWDAVTNGVASAFNTVKGAIVDSLNFIIDKINFMIGAFNKLPGPDIGEIGLIAEPSLGEGITLQGRGRGTGETVTSQTGAGRLATKVPRPAPIPRERVGAGPAGKLTVRAPVYLERRQIAEAIADEIDLAKARA